MGGPGAPAPAHLLDEQAGRGLPSDPSQRPPARASRSTSHRDCPRPNQRPPRSRPGSTTRSPTRGSSGPARRRDIGRASPRRWPRSPQSSWMRARRRPTRRHSGAPSTGGRTTRRAQNAPVPDEHVSAINWIRRHSIPLANLADPPVLRRALAALSHTLEGKPAANATIKRKKATFNNALEYAVELEASKPTRCAASGSGCPSRSRRRPTRLGERRTGSRPARRGRRPQPRARGLLRLPLLRRSQAGRGTQGLHPVSMGIIYGAWHRARASALTPKQFDSLLARRPYDLRHACLSTWLNAGVHRPRWPSGPATASTCC